jgi:hypothetical protein
VELRVAVGGPQYHDSRARASGKGILTHVSSRMLGDVTAYQRQAVPWCATYGHTQAANGISVVGVRLTLCPIDGAIVLWV